MDDISSRQALAIPSMLAVVALIIAAAISWNTGVDGRRVFFPYFSAWAAVSVLAILSWVLWNYSLAFGAGNWLIGGLGKAGLAGVGPDRAWPVPTAGRN